MATENTATAAENKRAAKCNFVAIDRIWKDHIHHEQSATKLWPENWHFLSTKYEDLVKDDFPDHVAKPKRQAPESLQFKPVTPISEYIKVEPSPKPVPSTTAQQIGWRSSSRVLALEKYGRYTKPKPGILNQLKWPHEGMS